MGCFVLNGKILNVTFQSAAMAGCHIGGISEASSVGCVTDSDKSSDADFFSYSENFASCMTSRKRNINCFVEAHFHFSSYSSSCPYFKTFFISLQLPLCVYILGVLIHCLYACSTIVSQYNLLAHEIFFTLG